MNQGEVLSFETGPPSLDTGSIEIQFTPRNLEKFMSYYTDENLNTIFEWKPETSEDVGEYSLMVRLYDDDDPDNPMSSLSVFGLEVKAVEQVKQEVIQEVKVEEKYVAPPQMNLDSMDSNGVLYFEFGEEFVLPPSIHNLTQAVMNTTLSLSIEPGYDQDVTKIGIKSFKFLLFSDTSVQLQVNFENPLYISMGDTLDTIRVEIIDTSYFMSSST